MFPSASAQYLSNPIVDALQMERNETSSSASIRRQSEIRGRRSCGAAVLSSPEDSVASLATQAPYWPRNGLPTNAQLQATVDWFNQTDTEENADEDGSTGSHNIVSPPNDTMPPEEEIPSPFRPRGAKAFPILRGSDRWLRHHRKISRVEYYRYWPKPAAIDRAHKDEGD